MERDQGRWRQREIKAGGDQISEGEGAKKMMSEEKGGKSEKLREVTKSELEFEGTFPCMAAAPAPVQSKAPMPPSQFKRSLERSVIESQESQQSDTHYCR